MINTLYTMTITITTTTKVGGMVLLWRSDWSLELALALLIGQLELSHLIFIVILKLYVFAHCFSL
jgi:hypothetical protein